jgi:hypothetical protein
LDLTARLLLVQTSVNCWSRIVVKRLPVALLVFGVCTPTVFAQSGEPKETTGFSGCVEITRGTVRDCQKVSIPSTVAPFVEQKEPDRVFSTWLEIIRGAERHYKNKHGRYGNLAALRKAHLLRDLVFESCSSAGGGQAQLNFVPKNTLIDVALSADRQEFNVRIAEHTGRCIEPPMILPDLEDSPEGLIFAG